MTAAPMPVSSGYSDHAVTVLLIDDQAIIGEAVRRMLAPEKDITFHYLADPTQAIETAKRLKPTCILQDLVMPQIDGLKLVSQFRATPELAQIPMIVLSSKEEPKTKAEAFSLGANDYLVKLPDRIELIARIRYHSRGYISLLQRDEAYRNLQASQKQLADDITQASNYVMSLLPKPAEKPFKADWRFVPCDNLGGDSFGYHWIDPDHFVVYLLDVCGHGVGAALLSVSAMNVLRSQSLPNTDFRKPDEVLSGLNDAFKMEEQNDMYFTIWYGVFSPSTRTLVWSGGGHPPALLLAAEGQSAVPIELPSQGPMVGAIPEIAYKKAEMVIPQGGRLMVYSDGVFEILKSDGVMWRYKDFVQLLTQPQAGLNDMDRLMEHTQELMGKKVYEDDFSMVEVVL
jgi:phosphoserine phosphatase RsbU/P